MSLSLKYPIEFDYLPRGSKRRSGLYCAPIRFIVAHDTGNDSSTARGNVNYYKRTADDMYASAHFFVDDKTIIECIPALKRPEKAWHVLYDRTEDNKRFGDDANDAAIGVELCYSSKGNINNEESYKRYVWLLAYLCHLYNLQPKKHIVGHEHLDPGRKTDPTNALRVMKRKFNDLIQDVQKEYEVLGKAK
ncbi:MAG: peptidoglycan recognition protein family protein [Bacilli bacterium]